MALARAGSRILRQDTLRTASQVRFGSSHADSHHHHDSHHEHGQDVVYPKENFSFGVWFKATLVSLGVIAFYKYAPTPGEDNYVARVLAHYQTPVEVWREANKQHLSLSAAVQTETLVVADAKKPPMHRYRYPQMLDQRSPHLQAVGKDVDMSGVVVKTDSSWQ